MGILQIREWWGQRKDERYPLDNFELGGEERMTKRLREDAHTTDTDRHAQRTDQHTASNTRRLDRLEN